MSDKDAAMIIMSLTMAEIHESASKHHQTVAELLRKAKSGLDKLALEDVGAASLESGFHDFLKDRSDL